MGITDNLVKLNLRNLPHHYCTLALQTVINKRVYGNYILGRKQDTRQPLGKS